jgi:hypothetical protein
MLSVTFLIDLEHIIGPYDKPFWTEFVFSQHTQVARALH